MPQILFPKAADGRPVQFAGDPFAASQELGKIREKIAKEKEQAKVAQEALFLHLAKQQGRANELNSAPAVEVPFTTEQGTGATVALEKPLPQRNPHIGGLMPLDQPGALVARGYLTETGEATPSGKLFLELHKQGLFDDKGLLTAKGKAFTIDPADALNPDNLESYAIRDKAGLNDQPEGPGIVDAVWNLGAGILKGGDKLARRAGLDLFYNPMAFYGRAFDSEEEATIKEAEETISNQEAFKQVIGSSAQLGSGIGTAINKAYAKIADEDWQYYAAKQQHDAFKADFQDLSTGELYGNLLDSKEITDSLDKANAQASALVGPEKTAQLQQEGGIAGGVLLDPANLLTAGIGGAVAKGGTMLKLSAKAEAATLAGLEAQDLAVKAAKARAVLIKTQQAAEIATKQAENLTNMGRATRAEPFRELAGRMATKADEAAQALGPLEAKAAEKATFAAKMADEAGGATAVSQSAETLREVGRQVRAAPARALAPVIESIGNKLIRADEALKAGLEKIGFTPETIAGARAVAATAGVTTGLGPLGFVPAALAAGPLIRGVGNFTRIIGKEMLAARGSVPFWQRVAQNTAASPVHRSVAKAMDTLTLGGKVFDPVRRAATIGKGIAAAAPVDLAFEALSEGGELNANTVKQSLAESILFGGGAAMANAVVNGKVADLRAKAAGDELNFRRSLEPDQLRQFSMLPKGARKSMAVYASVFPELKFVLREGGGGTYDRNSNTAIIDTTSPESLRPLIAHEVNHHIQIKAQMEDGIAAALVGDGLTGGLLRAADGTLDPNYKAAMDAYNDRMIARGDEPLDAKEFAVEYFNEATVDDLMGKEDSGEVQRRAGRSDFERMVRGIIRETIPRVPIIRDLSLRLGGAFDKQGNMVQGNGLLADGVRNLPFAKKMLREALREQAGRNMEALGGDRPSAVTIPVAAVKNNKPLAESLFSDFKTDPNGKTILGPDGLPEYIDKKTELKRAASGLILEEITRQKIERGDALPPGELAPQENGTYQGTHFSDEHITALRNSGNFNLKQIANLRALNQSAKRFDGATFLVLNQPALKRNKMGKKVYDGISLTFRESVPVGVSTTKAGNILIHFFSVTKFRENIKARAKSARGKRLYGGNEVAILDDAQAVMNLHKQGLTTDQYFVEKYGPQSAPEYKNFINTVFGLMTKKQQEINPLFEADRVGEKDGVYRTYRLDRINQTTKLDGVPMTFVYPSARDNKLPPPIMLNHFPNGVPEE